MKTKVLKKDDIDRRWYVVDASNIRLGKLATLVASKLIGKDKVQNAAYLENGDNVVVINASKVSVHPKKLEGKIYYSHSGYIGNLKERKLKDVLAKNPAEVIEMAVSGMLPKTRQRSVLLKRLYVYNDENHTHEAQKPINLEVK